MIGSHFVECGDARPGRCRRDRVARSSAPSDRSPLRRVRRARRSQECCHRAVGRRSRPPVDRPGSSRRVGRHRRRRSAWGTERDVVDVEALVTKARGEVAQAVLDRLAIDAVATTTAPNWSPPATDRRMRSARLWNSSDRGSIPESVPEPTTGRVAVGVERRVGHVDAVVAHARCVLQQSVLRVDRRGGVRSGPSGRAERGDLCGGVVGAAAGGGETGQPTSRGPRSTGVVVKRVFTP